jgi:hypothetical protein
MEWLEITPSWQIVHAHGLPKRRASRRRWSSQYTFRHKIAKRQLFHFVSIFEPNAYYNLNQFHDDFPANSTCLKCFKLHIAPEFSWSSASEVGVDHHEKSQRAWPRHRHQIHIVNLSTSTNIRLARRLTEITLAVVGRSSRPNLDTLRAIRHQF